jgi:nicotinate dehydrogenase subunit B
MTMTFTRRSILQGTSALIVTFAVSSPALAAFPGVPDKSLAPDQVDAFLAIAPDGKVTVYSGKVDLGTGVRTAFSQIVAEELDVPLAHITIIEGDTALTPDQGPSYGSLSIQNGGVQLRQAAATARRALLERAATQLKADINSLSIVDGVVAKDGRRIGIGELFAGETMSLKLDKSAPTKSPADFRLVGKSVPRIDIPDKVMGRFTYMQDFNLPGMLHARVVRPSGVGAELQSYDEASISSVPGIVKVVRIGNFLAVVAETEWAAIRSAAQLKVTWSKWEGLPDEAKLWEHVRATKIVKEDVTSKIGETSQALAEAAKTLSATYDFAIHTHGSIGPSCAVAAFENGKLTCWSASQATHNLRKQLAAMLKMGEADIRCIYIEGAGCYGRNGHEDAAADAALIARDAGRPVRVQWMRADEHGWDPKGPPTLIDLNAGLDTQGKVSAWESQFFYPNGGAGLVSLVGADLADLPSLGTISPGGVINNTAIQYNFPNVKTTTHRLESVPLKPSWIRTPGRMQNTFANESFLDEIAAAIGADPLEFRLQHLDDPRATELLERLAAMSQWRNRPKPDRNADVVVGRGISYVKYELYRTYVGAVAEVEVNRKSGNIRVLRFHVAHDCGQIINPDGLRNQIDGNVVQTVSRVLKEEVTFDRSRVTSLDWASYPILTFPEVPDIAIELIDRPDEKPWGAGEPSAAVVPAAISNAVFEATGARLRSIPFTPTKVKAALQGA